MRLAVRSTVGAALALPDHHRLALAVRLPAILPATSLPRLLVSIRKHVSKCSADKAVPEQWILPLRHRVADIIVPAIIKL